MELKHDKIEKYDKKWTFFGIFLANCLAIKFI